MAAETETTLIGSDEDSFVDLIRDHQAGVWRYLRFLGCGEALAEDLVQETFLTVWRRPFEDRGPAARSAYLRKVARSLYLKSLRKNKRSAGTLSDLGLEEGEVAWTEYARDDEGAGYRAALAACLQKLSERSRRALSLFYKDGKGRDEIAADLRMKPNGIKTLMRRSREKLRDCIGRSLTPV